MVVTFQEEYLRDYYEKGLSKDKKHRYPPDVIKRYKRCIDYLKAATSKEDLFPFKSLNFEALHGDKMGLFSVRVNLKYRVVFSIKETTEDSVLTICNIIELSNHYE
ncbi:MAG: type II toxin-antitoxin system RelE/ParE family toxin [Muribaculaceae bacterium]|nr:type II toxin-antitoxin system RelE/ParE family toxin [Muribaculaceae bacterium]